MVNECCVKEWIRVVRVSCSGRNVSGDVVLCSGVYVCIS